MSSPLHGTVHVTKETAADVTGLAHDCTVSMCIRKVNTLHCADTTLSGVLSTTSGVLSSTDCSNHTCSW